MTSVYSVFVQSLGMSCAENIENIFKRLKAFLSVVVPQCISGPESFIAMFRKFSYQFVLVLSLM